MGPGVVSPATAEDRAAKARAYRLKTLFDLTPEEYDTILKHQGGTCALCPHIPSTTRLAVDHNHKTGLVRGLLCWQCNTALGKFRDDDERLRNAAEYVTRPPAVTALGREVFGRKGRVTNKRKRRRTSREKTASIGAHKGRSRR